LQMTTRRGFMVGMSAAGALVLLPRHVDAAMRYDRRALDIILHRPARHRQVVAVEHVKNGSTLRKIVNSLNGYAFGYGEGPGTMHVVVVLYDTGVLLGLGDRSWRENNLYDIALAASDPIRGVMRVPGNPFLHAPSGLSTHDDPDNPRGFYQDTSIDTLRARGVDVLVCDNALRATVRRIATSHGAANVDDVAKRLHTDLIPGALLVPAGVTALDAAQEAHFTFLPG